MKYMLLVTNPNGLPCAGAYSAIIEVRKSKNDVRTFLDLERSLRNYRLEGHDVIDVISDQNAEPSEVPHFGYNYVCAGGQCPHGPKPVGPVMRWFGTTIVLEGKPTSDVFGAYDVRGERVELVGVRTTYPERRQKAEMIESWREIVKKNPASYESASPPTLPPKRLGTLRADLHDTAGFLDKISVDLEAKADYIRGMAKSHQLPRED